MSNLENINNMLPILKQLGISPDQLGYEKMEKLMNLTKNITNVEDLNTNLCKEIFDTIGINFQPKNKKPIKVANKIGRNELCHCGSNKKYKKCCIEK